MQPLLDTRGNPIELPPSSSPPSACTTPGITRQALADLQVAQWNGLVESMGSFADEHTTL